MQPPTPSPSLLLHHAPAFALRARSLVAFAVLGLVVTFFSGCASAPVIPAAAMQGAVPETITISEGDALKIAFPGASNLDSEQQVRRDGRITMPIIGEVVVTGITPAQLEEKFKKLYENQLVNREVSVTVVTSRFTVFVSGAVIRPGKVVVDHPLTALEALMEAGGLDSARADAKKVVVIRQLEGRTINLTVNVKDVLQGKSGVPFYLKQYDIIFVPEKFNWF